MCVYLFAPSRGQPLCFSLFISGLIMPNKIFFKYSVADLKAAIEDMRDTGISIRKASSNDNTYMGFLMD